MNYPDLVRQFQQHCKFRQRPAGRISVDWMGKAGVAICLLAGSTSSWASYVVDSHIETTNGTNRYTWTVYNQYQSWGLDGFAIEVPITTRLLAHTVPPPHSNPDRNAYWIMEERYEASVDPHNGKVNVPAPRSGMKMLVWWGMESPSVYPPGTSVTFSISTDSSFEPGIVKASASTYTPQNNPDYYLTWLGQLLGPGGGVAEVPHSIVPGSILRRDLPDVRTVLATNFESNARSERITQMTPLPVADVALHAGVIVEGAIGSQYGIQYTTALNGTNGWRGLVNLILSTPRQVWYDPEPAFNPQRYYRIVPGPISIP